MGNSSIKIVIWVVLFLGLLNSCSVDNDRDFSTRGDKNISTFLAVKSYSRVHGRPPKDKNDLIKFLECEKEDSFFPPELLEDIIDRNLKFTDLDTMCEYSSNDTLYYFKYIKKDGVYCKGSVCDSLEFLRKIIREVKVSFIESKLDSLAQKNLYILSPLKFNTAKDLIFKKEGDEFDLKPSSDSLINLLYASLGTRIPADLKEFGVDSLVLLIYVPYYSSLPPPPGPPFDR